MVFGELCKIFKSTFFTEHLLVTASEFILNTKLLTPSQLLSSQVKYLLHYLTLVDWTTCRCSLKTEFIISLLIVQLKLNHQKISMHPWVDTTSITFAKIRYALYETNLLLPLFWFLRVFKNSPEVVSDPYQLLQVNSQIFQVLFWDTLICLSSKKFGIFLNFNYY